MDQATRDAFLKILLQGALDYATIRNPATAAPLAALGVQLALQLVAEIKRIHAADPDALVAIRQQLAVDEQAAFDAMMAQP